ncbi:MAG TPA: aldehyde dehydrogenase family protein [Acidimicrobiales bacterium]|jgi:aldehyde dehydrogenase (NAD+)|nr:aldehyde dehydrogenase family protein [Acidimicrobiales bacterium]
MTLEESRMLIDGKLVPATGGRTYDNLNPATEKVIGVTADATADDMRDAIAAARRAFDETTWSTDPELRSRGIRQLATALAEDREVLRQVIVAEVGCPVMLTEVVQVDKPIDDLPFWADMAVSYQYEHDLPETEFYGGRHRRQVWREAVGVVAAINPWNYPLYLHIAKLGPALAAGCTVVLKPPPDTPWSATHIGRLIAERTDIPPGVVNIVSAADPAAGEVLTTDPRVDMVTFTGSADTGRRIMAAAAPTLKKIALELGGKSALIALDDSDVATTAMFAGLGMCTHAGQGCAMTSRLLVPRSRYDEAVEAAVSGMAGVKVGDPTDPEVLQGPQISARQRDRVLGYIEQGKKEGARIACGGGRPANLPEGYFVEPTVIADCDENSTVAQEEIFGPVLVVLPFDGDDDAVRMANNSIYGLSGAVMSESLERATSVARRLRTGTVAINGGQWFGVDTPFGGYKQSGLGRENGVEGFEEFLETKSVGLPA